MLELLRTKLMIPGTQANLVSRPRLLERLDAGLDKKLSLVSAPAGSGKTTLVVDWLKQTGLPAAWLSLDEGDNDLPRFLAYLAAAFQQVDEGIGASLFSALQSPRLPATEKVLVALLNELAARTEPLILVLDDAHLLEEPAIVEVLGFLLNHQPPQLKIVLTTREDPDLPLARWRARDQLNEIRARDLRFTPAEAGVFLRSVMGIELSEQDLALLDARTEGWAVGLQLAGLSMKKQPDLKAFIADFSGSHRHILDYLTEEVLQQQPESVRDFLLQTSILERLSGPLCDALTGRKDGEKTLAHLEAGNLFVIPLDEERRWYRYHHLFSDLLRSQLTRTRPGLATQLHLSASRWYEQSGDIQAAVEHALQAPDLSQAARLVEQHTLPRLYQGEVAMTVSWFDRLPEAVLAPAPMLCICKAWALVLMQRGARPAEIERALLQAQQALELTGADEALRDRVAGHAASIRAFLLRVPVLKGKEPEKLIALAQEAQRLLPAEEKAIRSTAALNMGQAYMALADLEKASLAFHQTLEDGISGENYYAAIYGAINQIIATLLTGRLREALQMCEANIARFNHIQAGRYFPPIGTLYILKGVILLETDHLAEAEQALTEGLALVRWIGEAVAPRKGYTALARLKAVQGDRPAVLEAVQALEEIWPEGQLYAQALRHRLLLHYWPDEPELQVAAHAWLGETAAELDEAADIHGVDFISRSFFMFYIHAAHVLALLARENPGVYPLEKFLANLASQQDFAASHGLAGRVVETALARTLLYQAAGRKNAALDSLQQAIEAAAPTGLFRTFVEEGRLLQGLLAELKPRLKDETLVLYATRLLERMNFRPAKVEIEDKRAALLSERELEVLQSLARGLSYEETGQQLFLSLNTIQFHVKNIYRKLLVSRRVQAIDKARQLNLI